MHFTSSYALYNYYVTNKETLTLDLDLDPYFIEIFRISFPAATFFNLALRDLEHQRIKCMSLSHLSVIFKDERNLRKLCSEMEENLEAAHKYRAENSVSNL